MRQDSVLLRAESPDAAATASVEHRAVLPGAAGPPRSIHWVMRAASHDRGKGEQTPRPQGYLGRSRPDVERQAVIGSGGGDGSGLHPSLVPKAPLHLVVGPGHEVALSPMIGFRYPGFDHDSTLSRRLLLASIARHKWQKVLLELVVVAEELAVEDEGEDAVSRG